ncbi:MAG: hypothetical protein ACRD0W_13835 [Acidimicrobiales bacterium]
MSQLPVVTAEINFDAAPAVSTRFHLDDPVFGVLDTSQLSEGDDWEDVSKWLMAFSYQRGVNEGGTPVLRYEAGTGTATLNNSDRRFDPTNLAGPYVQAGVSQIEPMRIFRLRANWGGATFNIAHAFIDWRFGYDGPTHSLATLELSDAFEILDIDRAGVSAVGAGELSGSRIQRILTSAGWEGGRQVAAGNTTLQATTLDGAALNEAQLVTDTELGELYVDGAGTIVFRNRHAQLTETRSTQSQATFGSDVAGGELPYVTVGIEYNRPRATTVRAARDGGPVQTAQVTARYPSAYERLDLAMNTDPVAADWAAWVLGLAKDPEYRFSTLTVDPRAMPDELYPQVLGRQVGDRITIIRRPPGGGSPIKRDVFIRGIRQDYGPGRWVTTWTLQSAIKGAFLVLDSLVLGKLDSNKLAY